MKKLTAMTDFVLEQCEIKQSTSEFKESVFKYAKFIKQPLELWMFAPCDEEWSVLNIPNKADFEIEVNQKCSEWKYLENENGITTYYDSVSFDNYRSKYQQAKERCLFEGFEFTKSQKFSMENKIKNSVHWYTKERLYLTTKKADGYHAYYQLFTVEDLIQCDLYLTQTAINQIGL